MLHGFDNLDDVVEATSVNEFVANQIIPDNFITMELVAMEDFIAAHEITSNCGVIANTDSIANIDVDRRLCNGL